MGAKPKPAPSQDQATNGAAESRIRVIKDMARCYMIQAHLGIEFFCYAVLYAVAIMNIAKNSVTKDIPFRRWFRAEPVIKDMAIHPLGCLATVWEEKKSRNQLGQKSYPGIYLGPTGTSLKLYLIFSVETQKITVERHVEIFPGKFPGLKKINGKYKFMMDILDLRKSHPDPQESDDARTLFLTAYDAWEEERKLDDKDLTIRQKNYLRR